MAGRDNMDKKETHVGHRERLRKRYICYGADSLVEHELLELLLFYVFPRQDTNEIAHDLINKFGDLNGVLEAPVEKLCEVYGVGKSVAEFLKYVSDVCKEHYKRVPLADIPESPDEYPDFLVDYFQEADDGESLVFSPGKKCNITFLKNDVLNEKSNMQKVMNMLIKREYNKVFIGENKASGISFPDASDFALHGLIENYFYAVGIMLDDFYITGRNKAFSLFYGGALKNNHN